MAAGTVERSILWFAFVLLFPRTFGALNAYLNYLKNALFWLLVGVLLRPHTRSLKTPRGRQEV